MYSMDPDQTARIAITLCWFSRDAAQMFYFPPLFAAVPPEVYM
jgi:hypothetical protein